MNFRIETNSGVVNITPSQLAEMLVKESSKPNRPWADVSPKLADELTRMLEDNNLLRTISLRELVTIAIDTGYYLNTFLRKNTVEVEKQDATQSFVDRTDSHTSG